MRKIKLLCKKIAEFFEKLWITIVLSIIEPAVLWIIDVVENIGIIVPIIINEVPRIIISSLIIGYMEKTGRISDFLERLEYTEIGFTGNVSLIDREIALKKRLKPLNKLLYFFFKPMIVEEKERRMAIFQEICRREL